MQAANYSGNCKCKCLKLWIHKLTLQNQTFNCWSEITLQSAQFCYLVAVKSLAIFSTFYTLWLSLTLITSYRGSHRQQLQTCFVVWKPYTSKHYVYIPVVYSSQTTHTASKAWTVVIKPVQPVVFLSSSVELVAHALYSVCVCVCLRRGGRGGGNDVCPLPLQSGGYMLLYIWSCSHRLNCILIIT